MDREQAADARDELAGDLEQTVLVPRPPGAAAPERDDAEDPDAELTVVRLIEPSAPRRELASVQLPVAPARQAAPTARASSVRSSSSALSAPPTSSSTAAAWSVRVRGTAAVVPLDVPVVVGRRPAAQRVPEHPPPRRIVIPADRADVSGRHVRIEQLGDTLVVSDLGSTNGVVVHWSSGSTSRLRPGESCALLPDAVVVLGEGVELEFLAVDESAASAPRTTV